MKAWFNKEEKEEDTKTPSALTSPIVPDDTVSYQLSCTPKESLSVEEDDSEGSENEDYRLIYVNRQEENAYGGFCTNHVVTSRYTIYNFLPKILFYEFSKLANAYFLVISIMQTIKPISNTGGFPASLPALIIIVAIDMTFAALEDYKRHLSDRESNGRSCMKLQRSTEKDVAHRLSFTQPEPPSPKETKFTECKWSELVVGDMIKLHNRDAVPADLVILATAEVDPDAPTGICYVETKSLDGETNLKLRQGLECTYSRVFDPTSLASLRGTLICEQPNHAIHRFCGSFRLIDGDDEPIRPSSTLLRGSTLRNTDWIYGMVINTGKDTKIMMTSSESPAKWSNMEKRLNRQILYICAFMFFLCLTGAIASVTWNNINLSHISGQGAYYLFDPNDIAVTAPVGNFFVVFLYYFLLLNSFIPVSLYVSMTTVKFAQSYFMNNDIQMYHPESNTPCQVRCMSLNEELGQVDYIFTDKTGTLTCNVMDFRKCSIAGISYGLGTTEIGLAAERRRLGGIPEEEDLEEKEKVTEEQGSSSSTPTHSSSSCDETCENKRARGVIIEPFVNFNDVTLIDDMSQDTTDTTRRRTIEQFFEHLALCHTVMPEIVNSETGEIRLSASSPDEQALVSAAGSFGYSFCGRSPGNAQIKVNGALRRYQILEILEFNSTRKRMSVIVRDDDGRVVILTKGADTVMYERLRETTDQHILDIREATLQHMETFACEGLRTLVIGRAEINERFYENWIPRFREAVNSLKDVELRRMGEDNAIDRCMEEIECNLEILGATAIEDRLQNGVPSSISKLSQANIKIWMLTGDKEETAINIGFACELLTSEMERVVIGAETHCNSALVREELETNLSLIQFSKKGNDEGNNEGIEMMEKRKATHVHGDNETVEYALIIDGEALELALSDSPQELLAFGKCCKAVIACRVSPAQKAQLVSLVRENVPEARTLAIGDGANDVSMIQTAHIGVGISGQEGMQAANSSDYSIAQFRYLERLLLVHGRWNYIRMAKLILYIFYKNVLLNLTQYWYMIYNGFSGQKFFLEWGLQGYNLFFTALPIVLVGVFEQDVPDYIAQSFPRLYSIGQENERFNTRVVTMWITSCIWESLIISFGTMNGLRFFNEFGATTSMWVYGCVALTIVILVVNIKLAYNQQLWLWFHPIVYLTSISIWLVAAAIISSDPDLSIYWSGVFGQAIGSEGFWTIMPLVVFVSLSRDILWKGYQRAFKVSYRHLAQEVHAFGMASHAHELLTWPPPENLPEGAKERVEGDEEMGPADMFKRSLKPVGAAVGKMSKQVLRSAGDAARSAGDAARSAGQVVTRPFRQKVNHRGFSFSYDAETVMAQSVMATERFKNLRNTFVRHGSRGSLAFREEDEGHEVKLPKRASFGSRAGDHRNNARFNRRHTMVNEESSRMERASSTPGVNGERHSENNHIDVGNHVARRFKYYSP